jgi:hypothetical protein
MIQVEPIINFNGFGKGALGEYFYSQGMNKSQFGLVPGWKIAEGQTDDDLDDLGLVNFFTQGRMDSASYVAMVDDAGSIYRSSAGTSPFALFYQPEEDTQGNGLIFDQKNRLLYAMERYLGMYDPTVSNYSTGTVGGDHNSTTVIGSGTTWNAGMEGKRISINGHFYTIATINDPANMSLTSPRLEASAAGLSYTIFMAADDQWKDFGESSTDLRQMDTYEDWVVIPNNNKFALLNITDDSFNDTGINFPEGFKAFAARSGRNGILLGLNFNNRGVVALWDAQADRSLAPWIWFNANVKCIIPVQTTGAWIVITSRGIYNTNGYAIETIIEGAPDDAANASSILANLKPQGADIIGKYLAFWGTQNANFNRNKDGLYLLNLETKTFEFAPVANGCLRGVAGSAIFFDNNFKTHLSYSTETPSQKFVGSLLNSKPTSAYFISERLGNQSPNKKEAEGVKVNMGINSRVIESAPDITFTLTAKLFNFKRPLWGYAQTNNASAAKNTLKIDGTIFSGAQVGDEVTIAEGINAGQISHITSIANPGLSNEVWTLDSELPELTEDEIFLSVQPFKLIKVQEISDLEELRDLYFDIKNSLTGKRFLVKFVLDNLVGVTPEFQDGYFIYDDKGIL